MNKPKTKPHKTGKKSKKKGKKKGLGAAKMAALKKGMGANVTKPIGVIVGLVAASGAGYLLDKVAILQPDPAKEGFQVKSLIKPVALLAIGATGVVLTHKKSATAGGAFLNGMSWGFAAGGALSGVKTFLKKDPFAGLGKDSNTSKAQIEANYYKNEAADLAKLLEQNKFKAELPELPGAEMNGMGNANRFGSEFDFANNGAIL